MALRKNDDMWWDATWNVVGGCRPLSPGCLNCYAARNAGTLHEDLSVPLYRNTTTEKGDRYTFNGTLRELSLERHREWTFPIWWRGAPSPRLGPGMPSLIFVGDMAEIFLPERPRKGIDRTFEILVSSRHIGLILTKEPEEMVAYLASQHPATQRDLRQKLWVGFSAENQFYFDERWRAMRALAERGWTVFVSVAPMLGAVRLPDDFLKLGKWVICSGEQGPHHHCRPMDLLWARALRDQCATASIPFFMKQMSAKLPIPRGLLIREFPAIG